MTRYSRSTWTGFDRRSSVAHPSRAIARALSVALWVIAAAVLHAPRASAQLPVRSQKGEQGEAVGLTERLADWYAQAKEWREAVLGETNAMLVQTRRLTNLRRQTQDRLVGEGGIIGGNLPHLGLDELGIEDPASTCAVDAAGNSSCQALVNALKHFERIYDSTYIPYKARVYFANPQRDFEEVLGEKYDGWKMRRNMDNLGNLQQQINESIDVALKKAAVGATLDSIAQRSQALTDSIKTQHIDSTKLSSGRATQLAALGAITEAEMSLAFVRQQLGDMHDATLRASGAVYRLRSAHHGALTIRP